MSGERELYWYDDATYEIGFYNYYQRTVDPSPWAFVACLLFCIVQALLLPRYLAYYRSLHTRKVRKANTHWNNNGRNDKNVVLGSQEFIASVEVARQHDDRGNESENNVDSTKTQSSACSKRNGYLPSVTEEIMCGGNAENANNNDDETKGTGSPLQMKLSRERALFHSLERGRFVHQPKSDSDEATDARSNTGEMPVECSTNTSMDYTSMDDRVYGGDDDGNKDVIIHSLGYGKSGNDKVNDEDQDQHYDERMYHEVKDTESSLSSVMSDTTNPIQIIKNDFKDFTRYNDPDESLSVASGWEENFDPTLQNTIYFHPATGLRTTEKPVEPISEDVRPWYLFYSSAAFRRKIRKCGRWDDEMEKIVGLALPYTAHTIVVDVFGLLEVGVIGRLLGTTELSAYFATEFAISFATMFFHGILASLKVLVSQAHGADNLRLAGNYVQIGVWTHHLFSLPLVLYGWNHFDDVVLRLGLDEETAESAEQYARYALIYEAIGIYDGALHCVLDVTGHEKYSAISNGVRAFFSFLTVLIVSVVLNKGAGLWMVGGIHLIVKVVFFFFNICVIIHKKWLHDYWNEMASNNPFRDWLAIKTLWKASLRLSSGRVIENCEWNILFVFAAIQGPAEVAIWGLVGELWDFADDIVIAVSDASKVRCAHLLGSGLPEQAKYSSEKSLLMGVVVSIIMSFSLGALRSTIPRWLTNDFTLQRLLGDMIPMVCLAMATLSFGSICWSILCAQGRAHLATAVTGFGSLVIALPLASLSNFCFNLNLQGLISSLIIGYATSGFCNSILVLTSNWKQISKKVRKATIRMEFNLEKNKIAYNNTTTDAKPMEEKVKDSED